MKFIKFVFTLSICLFPMQLALSATPMEAFKKKLEKETKPLELAKAAFGLGVLYYNENEKIKSKEHFELAIKHGTRLLDYANFYLGLIHVENKNYNEAKKYFELVVKEQPQSVRKVEAELQLALIAKQQEQWAEALRLLKYLARKYRGDIKHKDILVSYFEVASSKNQKQEACQAALLLYTKYPTHPIDPTASGCSVSLRDQERRFTQLLLSAEFDQIRAEIQKLTAKIRQDSKAHPQEMGFYETQLGRVNLSEGKIKEAIENFHTAQDMLGHTYTLQMLLGKAYSQTENYAAAIEPYVRAYEITPRNKKGHIALFQAAFLSYQNRDYDGAARRFEQLLKHARGKILTDTKWHMAWIRYLKEDYVGAIRAFQELSKDRRLDKVDKEKLLYWQAMSKYRMGFSEEAQSIFKILAQEKRIGYYTIAAQARLAVIPDGPAFIAPKADNSVPQPDRAINSAESENTNQSTTDSLAEPVQPETHTQEDEEQPQEQAEVDKQEEVTTLKEPKLALHFEKAKDIAELQVDDKWARLELREIEKRTRNISYLQLLMTEYAKVKEYNRSAYIADVVFARTREKEGFNGAAHYWQHAFPKAFESYILKSSEKFDIPSTLIWSVIRGESGYRVDIHSSAGALGLMQIIPKTGKKISENLNYPMFTKEMLLNPEINIQFGTWYLKRLNRIMGGYYPLVFASYNAGPHRVKGWLKEFGHLDIDEFIEHIPYFETRNYVKKIVRNYFIYNTLYNKKNKSFDWLTKKFTIRFDGAKPAREDWDE